MLSVVGLGPGRAELITRETWSLLSGAAAAGTSIYFRTKIHPTVDALKDAGIFFQSYDSYYEQATDFTELYQDIVDDLLAKARECEIIYVVPGSPFVAERTVKLLIEQAAAAAIEMKIYPAMSFLETAFQSLHIDPIDGLTILDAVSEEIFIPPETPLLITQVYSTDIASRLKLALMEHYPDEHGITFLRRLSLSDEVIKNIRLYELDWQENIDHLTTVYVPSQS